MITGCYFGIFRSRSNPKQVGSGALSFKTDIRNVSATDPPTLVLRSSYPCNFLPRILFSRTGTPLDVKSREPMHAHAIAVPTNSRAIRQHRCRASGKSSLTLEAVSVGSTGSKHATGVLRFFYILFLSCLLL